MLRNAVFLVLAIFFSTPCFGQDLDTTIPISYEKQSDNSLTRPDAQAEVSPDLDTPTQFQLFRFDPYQSPVFTDYWSNYANQPRVTYTYRYRGIRGVIYKQINRGLRRLYRRALDNSFEWSYLDMTDRDNAFRQLDLEAGDAGQRYWEQRINFWDYLPAEKGGHTAERITIGERYQIFELGPLALNNEGKVSWSGWRFSVSPERDIDRDQRGPTYQRTQRRDVPQTYNIGIRPPRGNLYTGDYFNVSGAVKFGVRLDNLSNNRSSITGKLNIICFSGYRKKPWLGIEIRGRARPFRNDYGLAVTISVLTW